jgi:hypothetical protein
MKSPILILCLIACTTALYAQNPRIETFGDRRIETYKYLKGGDSIRYTILGKNDTLQKTLFFRNGKPNKVSWQKDSMYDYDVLGRLEAKMFGINKKTPNDSNVFFYANGQIERTYTYKNKVAEGKDYNKQGKQLITRNTFYAPSVNYAVMRDRNGVVIRAERIDTIVGGDKPKYINYDTIYFDNGRVFKTSITDSDQQSMGIKKYNLDGSLSMTILPDSLQLDEFKDNVECFYGLKNKRGDTVIKPRFDRFEFIYPNMWGAHSGTDLFLFDRKGAPISIFPANLTHLDRLYALGEKPYWDNLDLSEIRMKDADIYQRRDLIDTTTYFYAFSQGKKQGVVTEKGEIVLPPQYVNIGRGLLDNRFVHFEENKGYRLEKSGFLNLEGKPLFSSEDYKTVMYTNYKDYFFLCEQPNQVSVGCTGRKSSNADEVSPYIRNEINNTFGLGKSDGTVLLKRKFHAISHVGTSPLFVTTLVKKENAFDSDYSIQYNGIFNTQSKRWLLDSVGFEIANHYLTEATLFVVRQLSNDKYGIMDTTGRYILPLAYDSIGIADESIGLYWVKKGKKYQLCEINNGKPFLHKTQYDFLSAISFDLRRIMIDEKISYFFAQRNGKWGLIDAAENIIKPFEYDYVAKKDDFDNGFIMVKDNQAAYFRLYSIPNSIPEFPHAEKSSSMNKTGSYKLVNNSQRICIINDTGRVLVPPQYKRVYGGNSDDYLLLEDDKKQKKLVFLNSGKAVDFPFDYKLAWANPFCDFIIVHDTAEISYGVVTTEGKQVVPCKNYGIVISDFDSSIFFVKQDTPITKRRLFEGRLDNTTRTAIDSLNSEDQNWMMYNRSGKVLSDTPFRFPFEFNEGIAIGMKGNEFNLYKMDGSLCTPFLKNSNKTSQNTEGGQNSSSDQLTTVKGFNNIRRDEETDFYTLFYNQGLTPTLILTKKTGEIVINGGRYDGISNFYGKYALVTATDKIGLVDTLGREIIAPQDVRTYSGALMDSLNAVNKEWYNEWVADGKKRYCRNLDLPIASAYECGVYHPDSLAIAPTQRAALWNLILDKIRLKTIKTASDVSIARISSRASAEFLSYDSDNDGEIEYKHKKVIVEDKTISFILEKEGRRYNNAPIFYNFYQRNNRWEELEINDLLQIQGEKRWQMNDLITKKVKALKDQQIDCSNVEAFIKTVENRWMLTKSGIDFCFDSTGDNGVFDGGNFVVVSLTWSELAPFLKMKIY